MWLNKKMALKQIAEQPYLDNVTNMNQHITKKYWEHQTENQMERYYVEKYNKTTVSAVCYICTARGVLAGMLSVLIIFVNVLIIVVFRRSRTVVKHGASGHFMISLAASDLCIGIMLPFFVYPAIYARWPLPTVVCEATGYLFFTCLGVSIWCLVCLSADRFFSLKAPFKYATIVTNRRCCVLAGIVWICNALVFGIPLFCVPTYGYHPEGFICGYNSKEGGAFPLILAIYMAPPCVAMYVFNAFIANIAFKQIREGQRRRDEHGRVDSSSIYRRNIRATLTLAIIVVTFSLTWLPGLVGNFLMATTKHRMAPSGEYIVIWLGISNSSLNFFIYYFTNRQFKQGVLKLLCCRRTGGFLYRRRFNSRRTDAAPEPCVRFL